MTQLNAPLEIRDLAPCNLQYGQVLVRVVCSGICGAQLQEIKGQKKTGPLPHPLGHEGCGYVEDVGPGVSRVQYGDKVVMHWRKGLGIESDFPHYRFNGGLITGGKVTTFGERAIVSENRVTTVPPETPDAFCALLGCGLSTALGTIEMEARLQFGERILIVGCGGLGINLILAARLAQASRIAVIDLREEKRATALGMGAHLYAAMENENWRDDLVGNFDVIVNTAAAPRSIRDTLPLLAVQGRYVLVGQPALGESFEVVNACHLFDGEGGGKRIMATQGGAFNPTRDIPRYVAMHRAGLLNLDGIISHRIGLEQINDGIALVNSGDAGRVLIEMPC